MDAEGPRGGPGAGQVVSHVERRETMESKVRRDMRGQFYELGVLLAFLRKSGSQGLSGIFTFVGDS